MGIIHGSHPRGIFNLLVGQMVQKESLGKRVSLKITGKKVLFMKTFITY